MNRKIKNTLIKSNFDTLLLDFRRCEINLKNDLSDFFINSRSCIIGSLKLEIRKKKLYSQIYSNLLRENKGRIYTYEKQRTGDGNYRVKKLSEQELNQLNQNVGVKREHSEHPIKQESSLDDTTSKKLKTETALKSEYSGYNLETGNTFNNFGQDESNSLFIFKRKKGQLDQMSNSATGGVSPGKVYYKKK